MLETIKNGVRMFGSIDKLFIELIRIGVNVREKEHWEMIRYAFYALVALVITGATAWAKNTNDLVNATTKDTAVIREQISAQNDLIRQQNEYMAKLLNSIDKRLERLENR